MNAQHIRIAFVGIALHALTAAAGAQGVAHSPMTAAETEIYSACKTALRSHPATAGSAAASMTVEVRRNRQAGHVVARCTASMTATKSESTGQSYVVLLRVADLYVMGVSRLGEPSSTANAPDI